MPPHPLTNFEIQKCHQNEPEFNGFYSRNNLTEIKDGAYVINFDEFKSVGTHWIVVYMMVIMGAHLMMQPTLTALEWNICQQKLKNS